MNYWNIVKVDIWKLYMKFGANKEIMENLSLQSLWFDLNYKSNNWSYAFSPG